MAKKTRQDMIKQLTSDPGVRRMIDLNLISADEMVDEFERQSELLCKFKQSLISEEVLNSLLMSPQFPGTLDQQMNFMMVMVRSIPKLDEFDKAVAQYLPVLALMTCMLNKQKELIELSEAVKV
jgi:hypothetical protein